MAGSEAGSEGQRTVGQTASLWAANSSCNGLPNIQRSGHPLRRACWVGLFLAGTGLTIWQVSATIIAFLKHPVNIHIIINFSSSLTFPAVSICNTNQIRKSALPSFRSLLEDILPHSYNQNTTRGMDTILARAELREDFDQRWALVNNSLKAWAGHQKDRMILDCMFNGIPCGPENFTMFLNGRYGNCFAFNTGWDGQPVQKTHKPGPASGLTLELFVEQEEYVVELTEDAGIRLLVHPNEVMPFPEDVGLLLAPGQLTLMSMRMTNISRLPAPYPSQCWDLEPEQAQYNNIFSEILPHVDYSLQGCLKTCYQAHVVKTCDCGDPTLPLDGKAIRGDSSRPVTPCQTDAEEACEGRVKEAAKADRLQCNCSSSCREVVFKNTGSSAEWPNELLKDTYYKVLASNNPHIAHIFNTSSGKPGPRYNLVKVQLYYEQLNQELIAEKAAYTPITLFGDIGGLFGFYLGLSVVAMFEFFEVIVDLLTICLRRWVLKPKVKRVKQDEKEG